MPSQVQVLVSTGKKYRSRSKKPSKNCVAKLQKTGPRQLRGAASRRAATREIEHWSWRDNCRMQDVSLGASGWPHIRDDQRFHRRLGTGTDAPDPRHLRLLRGIEKLFRFLSNC